jgi:hypothetical protein
VFVDDADNIPVLETWTRCRKISDDEWTAIRNGEQIQIFGIMPTNGQLLVSRKAGEKMITAGRIVLELDEETPDGQHCPA